MPVKKENNETGLEPKNSNPVFTDADYANKVVETFFIKTKFTALVEMFLDQLDILDNTLNIDFDNSFNLTEITSELEPLIEENNARDLHLLVSNLKASLSETNQNIDNLTNFINALDPLDNNK
ncbi:MAG: hypothetical protein WC783_00965 [Candidatus Paceibacterota bacterium]|jgi:hypothetical protein